MTGWRSRWNSRVVIPAVASTMARFRRNSWLSCMPQYIPPVPSADLLARLAAVVGPARVRHRRAELATYAMDGLPTRESLPGAVVMPGSRDEVIAVVRALHQAGVPWVARGAGTGLSGGAVADPGTVVIALTRLTQIL